MSGALFCFPRIKMQWSKPFYITKRFKKKLHRSYIVSIGDRV